MVKRIPVRRKVVKVTIGNKGKPNEENVQGEMDVIFAKQRRVKVLYGNMTATNDDFDINIKFTMVGHF